MDYLFNFRAYVLAEEEEVDCSFNLNTHLLG
jgi:hypothetical protein